MHQMNCKTWRLDFPSHSLKRDVNQQSFYVTLMNGKLKILCGKNQWYEMLSCFVGVHPYTPNVQFHENCKIKSHLYRTSICFTIIFIWHFLSFTMRKKKLCRREEKKNVSLCWGLKNCFLFIRCEWWKVTASAPSSLPSVKSIKCLYKVRGGKVKGVKKHLFCVDGTGWRSREKQHEYDFHFNK